MAASAGNRHVLKESEVSAMKKAGTWSTWLRSAFSMAECHPAAGAFEVTIVEDEGERSREGWGSTRRLLDLASLAELQGVSVCAAS